MYKCAFVDFGDFRLSPARARQRGGGGKRKSPKSTGRNGRMFDGWSNDGALCRHAEVGEHSSVPPLTSAQQRTSFDRSASLFLTL